ncbi:hypothetical protein OS493_024219 [Desmophyllum pertusum]|uniref:Homeobox domain-containing protein n=1 Tax=Desmophyllum pertusum TaxID=174260 RepID=A0A9X0CYL3_9CNID|nr:hypothetical protein OS493_024219 [Desmophyllum pertusum]
MEFDFRPQLLSRKLSSGRKVTKNKNSKMKIIQHSTQPIFGYLCGIVTNKRMNDNISVKNDINEKEVQKQSKKETCFIDSVPKRKRRNRSHFTQRQLQYLDKVFSRQQYLTRDERTLLARGLDMTELQIRNWFQNQRYQKKHRANENTKQAEPDSFSVREK